MWIPDPLYRMMPVLYAVGGVLTLVLFGVKSPSALSALLLFAAATVTWRWRGRRARLARQRRPGGLPRKMTA